VTITPTKNPGGRVARTTLVAGIRQTLGVAATAGAKLIRGIVDGKENPSAQRYDAAKWTVEQVVGKATVPVDLSGTIDGVIRHDHILKTADALLNQSPGSRDAPLSDTDMADNVPLLSPAGEEAAMDKED